jgi:Uma2 family endonuclease
MATAAIETRYTPDDLLNMSDYGRFELVDGQLMDRNMGAKSSMIGEELRRILGNYCSDHAAGRMYGPDCGFQIFPTDSNRVRFFDGALITRGRLPGDQPPDGHCRIAPDIGIEVVSPNDIAREVDEKVEEWIAAGVPLVWVVYPDTKRIQVFRGNGTTSRLKPDDELSGENVLPGFKCRVAEVFEGL